MESIVVVILVSALGLLSYKIQKNYEEIRDTYIKDGLEFLRQEISFCFAVFDQNYISLLTMLKHIRDYVPGFQITFKELEIPLKEYYPKGFAFRSIQNIDYLLNIDIISTKTMNLFSHFNAAKILFSETNLAIKKLIDEKDTMLDTEEKRKMHFDDLYRAIEEKREIVYEHLQVLDFIAMILNRIRDKHLFYFTAKGLKKRLKKDEEIQKLLQSATWNAPLKAMEKSGIPLTAFMGKFTYDEKLRKLKLLNWEKFKKLIDNKLVEPCSYKESTSPPEIQEEAEKWRNFLEANYGEKFSGAYRLSKTSKKEMPNIKELLLKGYSTGDKDS